MNTRENSELLELTMNELDLILGGECVVTIQKVPGYDMHIYYGCGVSGVVAGPVFRVRVT